MAHWDLRRLQMSLQKRPPEPVYLLVGEEPFLIDEALNVLRQQALADGASDFNFDRFYAGEDDTVKVRDTVEMLPMMSPRRVVVFRNTHLLKASEWEALQPVLEAPVDTTVFILVAAKLDKRIRPYKWISQHGVIVDLPRPYENQLAQWIEYIAAKESLIVENEAASLLRQFIGSSLTEMKSELVKLRDFLGERKTVKAEDVLKVVSRSRADRVFDLTNAIGRRDRALALQCLANLLEHGESEIAAVAMMARHLRILSIVRDGQKLGASTSDICARAGIPQFFLSEYQAQSRQWTDSKIENSIHALKETDKALKSSPVSSHIWLENLIIKTCEI